MKINLKKLFMIAGVIAGINDCAAMNYSENSSEIFSQNGPSQKAQKPLELLVEQADYLYKNSDKGDAKSKKIIYGKAIKKYNKIICLYDCPEILKDECRLKLANCHLNLGEVERAVEIYIQLVDLSSIVDRHAEIFNRLGRIEGGKKNYLKAISYYNKSIEKNKIKNTLQAYNYYRRGLAMQSMIAERKMMALIGRENPTYFPELINQSYELALTLKSPEGGLCLPNKLRAQCFFQRALLAKSMGQYEEADNFCQNALNMEGLLPSLKKEIENLQGTILRVRKREKDLELRTDFYLF